jgi:hypothetical protein
MNEDHFEFPRGLFSTAALTNVAQDVGTASIPQRVCWINLIGGAANEVVILRKSDASAEYCRIPVAAGASVMLPGFKFYASAGLEVLTVDAAGDVTCQVAYVDPTVGPGTLTGSWS